MARDPLITLLRLLQVFRSVLSRPAFAHLVLLFAGWVLSFGRHSVAGALVAASVSGALHHEAFHRFFSRGTWHPDQLALRFFFAILLPLVGDGPLRFVLDDTFCPHDGQKIFGIAYHRDPVRSSKKKRVVARGHVWVTLALLVRLPFTGRVVALPFLFRLYIGKKECARRGLNYRKKTQLAVTLLHTLAFWVGDRKVELVMDSGYCTDTVFRQLPQNFVVFGSMRQDAALTKPLPRRKQRKGRPRKKGERLKSPEQLAAAEDVPWRKQKVSLNGREPQAIQYKSVLAQWYTACGARRLKVVVVKGSGPTPLRVFFCTDSRRSVKEILSIYSGRVAIELCFRNLKQYFGFGESQARDQFAVGRTTPFFGLMYSVLLVWYAKVHQKREAAKPVRPWYLHKEGDSFEDVLRCARRVLWPVDFLQLHRQLKDLQKCEELPDPPLLKQFRAVA